MTMMIFASVRLHFQMMILIRVPSSFLSPKAIPITHYDEKEPTLQNSSEKKIILRKNKPEYI